MSDINTVTMTGRLTRDPELKYTANQTALCDCGLASNQKWGQNESVCFVDLKIWGKGAEIFQQYTRKGTPIAVSGRLAFESWEAKDGTKRSKHVIVVDSFRMFDIVGPGKDESASPPSARPAYTPGEDNIPF